MNLDEVEYCTQNWNPMIQHMRDGIPRCVVIEKIPQTFQKFVVKEKSAKNGAEAISIMILLGAGDIFPLPHTTREQISTSRVWTSPTLRSR